MTDKLAVKADIDLLDKHCTDLAEQFDGKLSEGLAVAKNADALILEQCQQDLQSFTKESLKPIVLETQHLGRMLEDNRERTEDIHVRHERLLTNSREEFDSLELRQKTLAASLEVKADIEALAAQEQRLIN